MPRLAASADRTDYYVYALLDPSKNDQPFYVGKGRGYRRIMHYCPSYLKVRCHKTFTIERYRRLGFVDKHVVLASGLTESDAFEREEVEIRRYGRRSDGGILVNQSYGGEGASGHSTPRTPEWKAKISAAHKGRKHSPSHTENNRRANLGKTIAADHRKKLSAALAGRPKSPEHRLALSAALSGKAVTREQMAACWAAPKPKQGKWHRVTSPDGRAFVVQGLRPFCAEHQLSNQHLGQVALGRRHHHKGWTASFCDAPPQCK